MNDISSSNIGHELGDKKTFLFCFNFIFFSFKSKIHLLIIDQNYNKYNKYFMKILTVGNLGYVGIPLIKLLKKEIFILQA